MAIYKLGDIIEYQKGYAFKRGDMSSNPKAGNRIIRISEIKAAGIVNNGTTVYYSGSKDLSKHLLKSKEIVMVLIGDTPSKPNGKYPGRCIIYNEESSDYLNQNMVKLIACDDYVLPEYLVHLLNTDDIQNKLAPMSRGCAGQAAIALNDLFSLELNLPSIDCQKQIIDIIKPLEELFLKHSSLVRIDTVDNCKNDISNLIDIIAPIERCIHNVQKQINVLKKILVNQYKLNNEEPVSFADYITVCSFKYNGQKGYLATNAISEFSIDYSKLQTIEVTNRTSRANLTPEANSLIISKLDGENKAYYIDESFPYVVSTGFFNFTTKYLDHITGFILSDSFKEQKSIFSTGTTMIGLNNDSLFKIKMVKPSISCNTYTLKLNSLLKVEQELYSTLNILIKLLIK